MIHDKFNQRFAQGLDLLGWLVAKKQDKVVRSSGMGSGDSTIAELTESGS